MKRTTKIAIGSLRKSRESQQNPTRREFLAGTAAASLAFALPVATTTIAEAAKAESRFDTYLLAFPTRFSYLPGETVHMCVSTNTGNAVSIVGTRFGAAGPTISASATPSSPADQGTSYSSPSTYNKGQNDWGWTQNYSFTLPSPCKSGVYGITVSCTGANDFVFTIVVRAATVSSDKILYKVPLNTGIAYGAGAPNMYSADSMGAIIDGRNTDSSGAPIAPLGFKTTLRRPILPTGSGSGGALHDLVDTYDHPLILYLESLSLAIDYCTDMDLIGQGSLQTDGTYTDVPSSQLNGYNLLLSAGHDEYWSPGMRTAVENHINGGGNVAFLGGNTCFWCIHYTDWATIDGTVVPTAFVSNKGNDINLGHGPDSWWSSSTNLASAEKSSFFGTSQPTPNKSETMLTGVSTRFGCILVNGATSRPVSGYKAQNTAHWAFDGTSSYVSEGQEFGNNVTFDSPATGLIGNEADGTPLGSSGGVMAPPWDQSYGTPRNFVVLGYKDVTDQAMSGGGLWPVYWWENRSSSFLNAFLVSQNERLPYSTISGSPSSNLASGQSTLSGNLSANGLTTYSPSFGTYSNYGIVFSGSTENWSRYLDSTASTGDKKIVTTITDNVISNLKDRTRMVTGAVAASGSSNTIILMQHESTLEPVFWSTNSDFSSIATGSIPYNGADAVRKNWNIVGIAPYVNSTIGSTYVMLLQNSSTNNIAFWLLDANMVQVGAGTLPYPGSATWKIVGFDYFISASNSTPQIIFEDISNGDLVYWKLKIASGVLTFDTYGYVTVGGTTHNSGSSSWLVVGTPHLSSTGQANLLFQNSSTGNLAFWPMTGINNALGYGFLLSPNNPGANWQVKGTPDLDGDGKSEILFQKVMDDTNATPGGTLAYWTMSYNASTPSYTETSVHVPTRNPWYA